MKTKLMTPIVAICLAALSPVSAADSVTEVFQKALFEEEANQNYDAAMRAYRDVVARMDEQRKLAATAVFRLGECYRKLGQTNEAVAQYQRIVRDFPDQPTLVNLSRQNLAGLSASPASTAGASSAQHAGAASRTAELDSLKEQQYRAREENDRLDHLLAELKKQSVSELKKTLPMLQPDPALAKLQEQESTAEQKRIELEQQFSANHPAVKAVDAVIKLIDAQIADRLKGILESLEIQRALAAKRMDQLQKQYNELRDQAVIEAGMTPTLSQDARLEQKRLLEEEIKLAEQQLASIRATVANGVAPKDSTIPKEREILVLRRQLAALDLGSAATSPASTAETGATDEEDKEIRRIQAMIKNSPDLINAPGPDKLTPLDSAARKGQLVVARFLLDNKADPNFRPRYGTVDFPLSAAATYGHKAMVELLLARGAQVNADDGGALRIAAEKGFTSVVESLLAAKANPNARDYRGETALHRAVENRFPAIAELLIKNGADVNAANRIGKPGDDPNTVAIRQADGTPLHIAASQGDVAMVSLLLSNRADVSLVNFLGETPLHVSASQLPIVTNLLAAGADVNRAVADGPFKGWTPLLYAVSWNGTNAAKALLKAGADPNAYAATVLEPPAYRNAPGSQGRAGYTPLLMAVTKKQPEMVNLLLENKADPNKEIPLGVAVSQKDVGAARILLEHGAMLNVGSFYGETLLTQAVLSQDEDMIRLLLQHKADVNAKAKDGLTPLHQAVRFGKKEIVEMLLAAKADVNATDNGGLTPLGYTTPNRYSMSDGIRTAIAGLLRKGGASEWMPRPGQITLVRKGTGQVGVPFTQGTNQLNYHTLYEAIAGGPSFSFPDLRKVTITRRDAKTGKLVEIPVDVEALVASGDCSKDPRLEWGDLVDIPEREHKLGENWVGEPEFGSALAACLARTVTITVRDQVRTNAFKAGSRPYLYTSDGKTVGFVFAGLPFRLSPFVKNIGLLLTTSDQTHVRVRRTDPATGQKREWIFDLTRPEDSANDLWLRDGDEIEVPDK